MQDDGYSDFSLRVRTKLRTLRLARGWRQEDLEDFGVPHGTYRHIENGTRDPKMQTLFVLSRAFELDLYELLDVRDVEVPDEPPARGGHRQAGKPA